VKRNQNKMQMLIVAEDDLCVSSVRLVTHGQVHRNVLCFSM